MRRWRHPSLRPAAALFGRAHFAECSAALQALQGRFILYLNNEPAVRALFAWASIKTVELSCEAVELER
jgi:DNA adenine methylase